ncbi:hypothetical protein [Pyrobaculum aerophilum]|uniref:hypothetical protein n=1 Tax=Pyrobaculum aerophilum TaxID=13773 RepID=UPI002FD8C1B4
MANWVLYVGIIVVVVVGALWLVLSKPGQAGEVVLKGRLAAVVTDYVNKTSRTDYFLQVVEDGKVRDVSLDLSNATIRLKDFFNNYIGTGREVYVRGYWRGDVFVALEVYD